MAIYDDSMVMIVSELNSGQLPCCCSSEPGISEIPEEEMTHVRCEYVHGGYFRTSHSGTMEIHKESK